MAETAESLQQPKTRVMVIDDDPGITDLILMTADEMGVETCATCDYEDIASQAVAFDPDIVFLDLCLPQRDGIEVLSLLAKRHCDARIYLISGMDKTILASACVVGRQYKLNIAGSLEKPFKIEDIEACLAPELETRSRFTSENFQDCLGQGEFVIHYLPLVGVESTIGSKMLGVEVFPYWKNKSGDTLELSKVINTIRANDLLPEFNELLLDKSLESYSQWLSDGLDMGLTIGMDEQNLDDENWPGLMIAAIDRWGLDHNRITVSLENTAIKKHAATALDILTRLRIGGLNIAIETEGNDEAELDDLLHLPFSEMRLQSGVVNQIGANMEAEFNVSTLISLAQKQNLKTCAVGVTTLDEFCFLKDCKCTMATGRFFGKPLAVTQVEEFVKKMESGDKEKPSKQNSESKTEACQ